MIISDKYGDDRRTAIGYDDDMSMEDLIPDEDTIIAMTHLGYIKRMDVDNSGARTEAARESRACRPLRRTISRTFS